MKVAKALAFTGFRVLDDDEFFSDVRDDNTALLSVQSLTEYRSRRPLMVRKPWVQRRESMQSRHPPATVFSVLLQHVYNRFCRS